MQVTFDPAKDAANLRNHGISLDRANNFDLDSANYEVDDRHDYGEVRYRALGFLDGRLFTFVFAEAGQSIRANSLRGTTRKERDLYANSL